VKLTYRGHAQNSGAVAIVTGVSRALGIGAATTRLLAESGVPVLATGWMQYDDVADTRRSPGDIEELLHDIKRSGGTAAWVSADISEPAALPVLLDEAEQRFGTASILVNNAAYSLRDGWSALSADLLDAHYAVNIRGAALLTTEFARRWPGGEGGRVVNLTSGQFKGPMVEEIAYVATKGAVDAMTITLAAELAPLGITVNAVGAGPTDTGWMTKELEERLLPQHPFGRLGQPEDIARLIAFLASDQAGWITGQIIHTEGGFLRQ
jgi:3-oxoacyl-[acyl-carrier protein] reductase